MFRESSEPGSSRSMKFFAFFMSEAGAGQLASSGSLTEGSQRASEDATEVSAFEGEGDRTASSGSSFFTFLADCEGEVDASRFGRAIALSEDEKGRAVSRMEHLLGRGGGAAAKLRAL